MSTSFCFKLPSLLTRELPVTALLLGYMRLSLGLVASSRRQICADVHGPTAYVRTCRHTEVGGSPARVALACVGQRAPPSLHSLVKHRRHMLDRHVIHCAPAAIYYLGQVCEYPLHKCTRSNTSTEHALHELDEIIL